MNTANSLITDPDPVEAEFNERLGSITSEEAKDINSVLDHAIDLAKKRGWIQERIVDFGDGPRKIYIPVPIFGCS